MKIRGTYIRRYHRRFGYANYLLINGTRIINKLSMTQSDARECNEKRKKHGHPLWHWDGK